MYKIIVKAILKIKHYSTNAVEPTNGRIGKTMSYEKV